MAGAPRKFTNERMIEELAQGPTMQAAAGRLGVTPSSLTYRIKRDKLVLPPDWVGSKAMDNMEHPVEVLPPAVDSRGELDWLKRDPPSLDLYRRELNAMDGFLSSLAALPDDESRRRVLNHVSAATAPLFEPV